MTYGEHIRQRALALLAEGKTAVEVSALMGGRPSPSAVRAWARGREPAGHRTQRHVLSHVEKIQAVCRLEDGGDYVAIAREAGCTPAALLNWRRAWREGGEDALRTRIDRRFEQR